MKGTVVTDTFTRTLATGWGSATTGQAWSLEGLGGSIVSSDWSVNGTQGLMSVPAVAGYRHAYLGTFSQPYVDLAVDGSIAVIPTGGAIEMCNLSVRGTSSTSYYLYRVQVETSASVTVLIYAPGGAQLGSITVPGLTYTANLKLRVRVQAVGKVFRMKVWQAVGTEPAAWVLSVVDSTYTGAGWIGIRSGVAGGNTNTLPVVFSYDNLSSVLLPDFPRDKLPLTVLMAFGADLSKDPSTYTWTDVTRDVLRDTVTITPGRPDETSQAPSASCTFQLKNFSKAYSANNPLSPNYPNVRRNTPVWVMVDPATRFFGYCGGFPPSWDASGKVPIVNVAASSSLRRTDRRGAPTTSPLRRAITARPELRAYWPMEDAAGSTTLASGIPGGRPMNFANLTLGADATEPGSLPLPTFAAQGAISGQVTGSFASQWQVDWYYKISDPTPADPKIMTVFTSDFSGVGGLGWDVNAGGAFATVVTVRAFNALGTKVVDAPISVGTMFFGQWVHGRLMVQQSGGNISWQIVLFPLAGNGVFWNGTIAGTVGAPHTIVVAPDAALNGMDIGHLAVFDAWNLGAADAAQSGFTGDLVTDRLTRVCADAGIPLTIIGTSGTRMGPQPIDNTNVILRECEAADLGMLYDGFGPGLTYVTRSARYNQPAALTANMAAGQVAPPFAPADDDQRNRNRVTVSRKGGSNATYEDKTGPLGTDPLTGIGAYPGAPPAPLNLSTDDVLYNYASWLTHLGTVEGFRYPNLHLDLASPGGQLLIDDWSAARLLSRFDVLNVDGKATGHTPGTVSLLLEGYTETLGPKSWKVTANCSLYDPYRVAVVGTDRVDSGGSKLTAGITSSATSFSVTTTAGLPWGFADGAFDINIDGERMTVTNVTPLGSSPQTFTVTRGVNGAAKAHNANAPVRSWKPAVVAL